MNSNQHLNFTLIVAVLAVIALLLASQFYFKNQTATAKSNQDINGLTLADATKTSGAGAAGHADSTDLSKEDVRNKPDSFWKARLSPETYHVTREKGTERPFTGALYNNHEDGNYYCSNCGALLFTSKEKFESGTGWPSFFRPALANAVGSKSDKSMFMERNEVICAHCGAHLGHVFDDGPKPTGQRYCINSCSLSFKKEGAK